MKPMIGTILLLFILALNMPASSAIAAELTEQSFSVRPGASSSEIQEILNYNKSGGCKLTVNVPAGTYTLDRELRIHSNTTIIADPEALFQRSYENGAILANDLSGDAGGYFTTENVTISGGIWDSVKVENAKKGSESFRFIHASNITIKDATLRNVPEGSHLITFAGVKNGMVENCILYGYEGSKPKEAIQLDIVHNDDLVPSMQVVKIKYDDLACDGIIIRNNEIYNYPRAIGSHTSVKGVFHKNITITQNYLHDLEEAAIKAYNYINLVISNNTIENSAIGVLAYTTLDNETGHYLDALPGTQPESLPTDYKINITENTIKNIHQYKTGSSLLWGDGIRIIGSKDRILPGISISKNKISDTKRSGIYVSYAPKGYIGSNTITGTSWHALYVDQCEASKVYYNKINTAGKAGSTYGGIGISSSGNSVIYKNTVKAAAKNGIFLYNSSTGCTIKANSINAAADNAIAVNLSSNNAKIISNKITGNTKSSLNNRGIFVYGANYASITLNTISSCRAKQEINTNNSKGSKISNNKINK